MKTVASLAFGIASAIGACIGTASVASLVLADTEIQGDIDVETPVLWTTTPMRVDPASQNFERLPAVLSTYALNPGKASLPSRAVTVRSPQVSQLAVSSKDHMEWCAAKYRSFDTQTNSYRSFSGEVRTCRSPFGDVVETAPLDTTESSAALVAVAPEFASWCAARYNSYRAEDNTYQPYSGPRRSCQPPVTDDEYATAF